MGSIPDSAGLHLAELDQEVARSLGRSLTSAELLDLLAWGLRRLPEEAISGLAPVNVIGLRARYRRGVKAHVSEANRLGELNDAAWNESADLIALVAEHVGGPLSYDALLERVLVVVHGAGVTLLSDIKPTDIIALIPRLRRGKARPKVGDVVAIPAPDGSYIRAVVVAHNPFGTAFGIFLDRGDPRPPYNAIEAPVLPHPVYSDDEQVILGRWLIVGHLEELLDRFPRVPELMQAPWPDGPRDWGEHGQARSPEGPTRPLTVDEARAAGMHIEGYRESFMSEQLEVWLPKLLQQQTR